MVKIIIYAYTNSDNVLADLPCDTALIAINITGEFTNDLTTI